MGRSHRQLGALAVALATLTLILGGAAHALAPLGGDAYRSALCFASACPDAADARCDARDADSPASPGAPAPHKHQRRHDHRCVLCQLLRVQAALTETPAPPADAAFAEFMAHSGDALAPAAPSKRRNRPRAPPRA